MFSQRDLNLDEYIYIYNESSSICFWKKLCGLKRITTRIENEPQQFENKISPIKIMYKLILSTAVSRFVFCPLFSND